MQQRRSRFVRIVAGVGSMLAIVALLVGIPAALLALAGSPIPAAFPSWQTVLDTLGSRGVTDTLLVDVVAVIGWIAWLQIATSTAIELVAWGRGRPAPRLRLAGPAQPLVRQLIATAALLLSSSNAAAYASALPAHPIVAIAAPLDTAPASTIVGEPPQPAAGATPSSAATDEMPSYAVVRYDTLWGLAEAHLGDPLRWQELYTINQGRPQPDGGALCEPDLIRAGWTLLFPADAAGLPVETTSAPQPEPVPVPIAPAPRVPATQEATAPAVVHVVEPGDSLSRLAERYLGDPARYQELFDANRGTVQPDGRRLVDPSLVVVGWHLVIPMDPAPATADEPAQPPPDEPTASAGENAPAATEADSATEPPTAALPTTPTTPPAMPATEAPTTASPTTGSSTPTTPAPAEEATPAGSGSSPLAPIAAGISGAAVLATGLALRFQWLRHRRATHGARRRRVATPAIEHAALTTADVPLVRWAGQHLALLVQGLDGRRLNAGPVAVELSDQTGIEILWDAPQHAPVPGEWTAADGGWAWRLSYDAEAPIPADELTAAIPALVTIGRRDNRDLLVDLEAFGALTVGGPEERTDAFIRSVAVELSCGNDLSDAYVSTVGFDLDPGIAPRHRLTTSNTVTALAHLEAANRSIGEVLEHDGAPDTFHARAGARAPIEVTVVVARDLDPADLARLTQATGQRRGVAVVATSMQAGPHAAHVQIDPTGTTAQLDPLGITFRPVGMHTSSSEAIQAAVAELADLGDDVVEPPLSSTGVQHNGHGDADAPVEQLSQAIPHHDGATGNGESPPAVGSSVQDARAPRASDVSRLVVRVLGVPAIPKRPSIGRRELILAVLLASRDGTVAASAAQDALWGGKPVEAKTVWNFVANVRRALGDFDDGSPVMPAADRTHGTLHLDARVTTDFAMLREVVAQAPAMSSAEATAALRDGLALVDGPPFDAPGYDWAHRDQDVAEAGAVIEQAVDRLVTLAVDAGQIEIAREAVTRGLRGLPGDEHCYRARMRVEATAGNHAGIVTAYEELTIYLAEFDTEPSPATTALYHELIRQPRVAPSSIR